MTVSCPACEKQHSGSPQSTCGEFEMHGCTACGLTFCSPMSAGDAEFYESNESYDEKWEFALVAEMLRSMPDGRLLLDIGCGDGRFLERLIPHHRVRGIDFNPRAIHAATEKGINAYALSLEDYRAQFPSDEYDVITLFHVLEHVSEPGRFIEILKRCLRRDGLLGVSVPNPNRWTLFWTREAWDYPPHHLTRWDETALTSFLRKHGFEVVGVTSERVRTWQQVQSGVLDLMHTLVLRRLSFGLVSKLSRPSKGRSNGATARLVLANWLRLAKVRAAVGVASTIATVLFPILRIGTFYGKSLLVVARKIESPVRACE